MDIRGRKRRGEKEAAIRTVGGLNVLMYFCGSTTSGKRGLTEVPYLMTH